MDDLSDLKKILHLHHRKDRGVYFTRLPIPEDLQECYKTSSGKFRTHLTKSITASSSTGIKKAHTANILQIELEFRDKRKKLKSGLLEVEEKIKEKCNSDIAFKERNNARLSKDEKLLEELSKIATNCKLSDLEICSYLLDWFEIKWAETNKRLQDILRLKSDISSFGSNPEKEMWLSDLLWDPNMDLWELTYGVDSTFGVQPFGGEIRSKNHLSPDRYELLSIFVKHGFKLDEGSPPYLKYQRLVRGVLVDLLKWIESSYDQGEFLRFQSEALDEIKALKKDSLPIRIHSADQGNFGIDSSVTIAELFEKFREHTIQTREVGDSALSEMTLMRNLAVEVFHERQISSISKAEIMEMKNHISNMVDRRDRRFCGKPILETIEIGIDEGIQKLNNSTVDRYRHTLHKAFLFGAKSGWIDRDIIAELDDRFNEKNRSKNITPSVDRLPFDENELKLIFASPTFTGMKGESQARYRSGNLITWDHHYWGPLIALFTGMRPKEICQMRIAQVKTSEGVLYFDVKSEFEDQSIKTNESGFRKAPIHEKLVELGFLDYIRNRDESDYILHSISDTKDKNVTGYLTSWFNSTQLKKLGIVGLSGQKVFYSFRHTFATIAMRSGISDGMLDELCGWSSEERRMYRKSMRENYTATGYGLPLLKEAMDKINFPSIDFSKMNVLGLKKENRFQFVRPE